MQKKSNYKTIYDAIKDQIIKEDYALGSMLPTENILAEVYSVSRPTIAKVYNKLQEEGLVKKTRGLGTVVTHQSTNVSHKFGLLLPGAGESEIFSIINDQILMHSEIGKFQCLWEGATANNAEIRRSLIESCCEAYIQKRVDGIFFAPLERIPDYHETNQRISNVIKEAGIPLILIDRDITIFPERSEYDLVSIDNFSAGYTMAQHLIDQGCTTIHFFSRPNSASSVDMRLYGIKSTAIKNGLVFNNSNVFRGNPEDINFVKRIKVETGKTGIICANDSTAAVLMSSLDAIGVKVSTDILLCGYDDMKYSEYLKHPLTSYRQPCEEIANVSIELLMKRLRNKESIPKSVTLKGDIVIRNSTQFL